LHLKRLAFDDDVIHVHAVGWVELRDGLFCRLSVLIAATENPARLLGVLTKGCMRHHANRAPTQDHVCRWNHGHFRLYEQGWPWGRLRRSKGFTKE
jgi:hypothetical protein